MNKELQDLILDNKNLIYSMISKYRTYYDLEDLYQVAVEGMIKAYNNYKKDSNAKFTTYAYTYILGEISKYKNDSKSIRISKEYLQLSKKINEAKILLTQKLMYEPSNYELSIFLEIDESIIENINMLNNPIDSLDKPIIVSNKELSLYDVVDNNNIDYIEKLYLYQELDKLDENERKLLEYRYFMDKSQQEVSNYLGINQVQVSRCEKKILSKLKRNMELSGKK